MENLKEKLTIVTGAGAGIGQATAKLFASEGAVVYAIDIIQIITRSCSSSSYH